MSSTRHILLFLLAAALVTTRCADESGGPVDPFVWETGTLEEAGLDSVLIHELIDDIRSGEYREVHSLLIYRRGRLVVEEYFRGYRRELLHQVYSVTKSVTSALIGIAIDEGAVEDTGSLVLPFFPEYSDVARHDSMKRSIVLEDLLTMRSGLAWYEFSVPYTHPDNPVSRMANSGDWIRFVLETPMIEPPGTIFRYSSGVSVLLGGILSRALNRAAVQYADRKLFAPLGIVHYRWDVGAKGELNTGWGLHLRPRDMLKIGCLILREGVWENSRVVPKAWVRESLMPRVIRSDTIAYGYQWWLMPIRNRAGHTPAANDIRIAWGWGDQFIFIIPSLEMVVVSTGGNFEPPDDQALVFLRDFIIPAAKP